MAFATTVPEILAGTAFELVIFSIAGTVIYRLFSGRFLVPKREIVLPNQLGVIVKNDHVVRIAGPGACWVRPNQRVVLIDARPKPLQMAGLEVIGSDRGIVRISLSAEYRVADAAAYYQNSANATDAFFVQIRRAITVAARQSKGAVIAAAPDEFSARILRDIHEPANHLGLEVIRLDIYESLPLGTLRVPEEPEFEFPESGMVH